MTDPIDALRSKISFKRTPMDPGDGGIAFLGFLSFANGDSDTAKTLKKEFYKTWGFLGKTIEESGAAYVDWLIETQWGEETASPLAQR